MAVHPDYSTAVTVSSHRSSLKGRIYRAATSPAAKIAYVAVGTAGLAALALAIFGRPRLQRETFRHMRRAVSGQADWLWNEARPIRAQLRTLIGRAGSESGREKLIRNFQSWIGHFRAG